MYPFSASSTAATAHSTTTEIHEIRAVFTACMFAEMTDATLPRASAALPVAPTEADAQAAVARFEALSDEIRGGAILGPDGAVLASSGDLAAWGGAAVALLAAADAAAAGAASHAHVATEEGEVYAVRWGGIAMVAVSERFALASLMLNDMRATLRGLAATTGAG